MPVLIVDKSILFTPQLDLVETDHVCWLTVISTVGCSIQLATHANMMFELWWCFVWLFLQMEGGLEPNKFGKTSHIPMYIVDLVLKSTVKITSLDGLASTKNLVSFGLATSLSWSEACLSRHQI
jgi:hypothetical protein